MTGVQFLEYLKCDIDKSHQKPWSNNCYKIEGKSSCSSGNQLWQQKKKPQKRKIEVMYICFRCLQLTQTEGHFGLVTPILFLLLSS